MKISTVLCVGMAVTAIAGSAQAFDPWSNPSGTASFFDWSNGGSDTGLFGSPVLVGGDTFVFFPSNFRAESIGGGSNIAYDRLQFEVEAHAGFSFSDIRITEYGDYGIIGSGSVEAGGTLFVTDISGGGGTLTDNLLSSPGSPITSGIGNWSGTAAVDTSGWGSTHMRVTMNNNLIAISIGNSVVWIQKKVQGSAVGVQIIPTPGSLALIGLGGLAAVRRRR